MNENEVMETMDEVMEECYEAPVEDYDIDSDVAYPDVVTETDEEGNPLADLLLLAGGVVVGVTATVLIPKAVSGCKKGYSFIKGKVNDWKEKKKQKIDEPTTEENPVAEPVETEIVEEPVKATPKKRNK